MNLVVYTLEQKTGKYCDITFKIMVMFQKVFKNCVRILEEEQRRRYLVKKVKETGILIDKPKREKSKTVGTSENIAAVTESVCEAPSTSIHRHSQQLNISETLLRRILHKELGMTSYKV